MRPACSSCPISSGRDSHRGPPAWPGALAGSSFPRQPPESPRPACLRSWSSRRCPIHDIHDAGWGWGRGAGRWGVGPHLEQPHLCAGGACYRPHWAGCRSWRACWPTPCTGPLQCSGSLCSATEESRAGPSHPQQRGAGGSAPETCGDRETPLWVERAQVGHRLPTPPAHTPLVHPFRQGLLRRLRTEAGVPHHCPPAPPAPRCCPSTHHPGLWDSGCSGVSRLYCLPLRPPYGSPASSGRGQPHRLPPRQAVWGKGEVP